MTVPANTRPEVTCEILENMITCREVERREVDGKKAKFLVCLAVEVPVRIRVGDRVLDRRIIFLKQAILCAPSGTEVECQVTGNCCCIFDPETNQVSCVFDFCVIIQSKVTVRVLVPTLGMCVPKECRSVIGGCPPRMAVELCDRCDDDEKEHDDKDCDC